MKKFSLIVVLAAALTGQVYAGEWGRDAMVGGVFGDVVAVRDDAYRRSEPVHYRRPAPVYYREAPVRRVVYERYDEYPRGHRHFRHHEYRHGGYDNRDHGRDW